MGPAKKGRKPAEPQTKPPATPPEPGAFTQAERDRVEELVSRAKGADPLAARILAEELVNAQRTTRANAGSTSGDLVKGSAAALRSIMRALGDLGLLEPPKKANPLDGLLDEPPATTVPPPGPPKKPRGIDEALNID